MKKIFLFVFVVIVLLSGRVSGQEISGTISDSSTGEKIGYVNIGVIGKPFGTVSGQDGHYRMELSGKSPDDTVRFSYIGYEPFDIPVADLMAAHTRNIILTPADYAIAEVVVRPSSFKEKRFGNNYRSILMALGADENNRGFEAGVAIDFKKKVFLEKARINIWKCTYDEMVFRLNIYCKDDNGNYTNILREPIYAHCGYTEKPVSLEIDLSPYGLAAEGETIVSFEHIEDAATGKILFPARFVGSKSVIRNNSHEEWETQGAKFPISVTVLVGK